MSQKKDRSTVRAVFPNLLVALAAVILPAAPGGAAPETCFASPNATPPQGSHWFYRTDRTTQRKCWYLGAQGKSGRVARTEEPVTRPTRVERKPEQPSATLSAAPQSPALRDNTEDRIQRFIYGTATAAAEPMGAATTRPDAETAAAPPPGVLPWPAPAVGSSDGAEAAPEAAVPATSESAATDAQENEARDVAPAPTPRSAALRDARADTVGATPLQMMVLFIAALAIAGSLLHTIFKITAARRRRVYVDRRDGAWTKDHAYDPPMYADQRPRDFDAPPTAPADRVDTLPDRLMDAEHRLTKILRALEPRAA